MINYTELHPTPEQADALDSWADALESGRFEQTTTCLQSGVGYCCWGVAGDINNVRKEKAGYSFLFLFSSAETSRTMAPEYWTSTIYGIKREEAVALAILNDAELEFIYIAKLLRARKIPEIPRRVDDDEDKALLQKLVTELRETL